MSVLAPAGWVFIIGYAAVVAGWWFRHLLISLVGPFKLYVTPIAGERTEHYISVIIPARNEAARIARCVTTVLQQGPTVKELIVVDDRSDDGTADVVRKAAGNDTRARTIRVDALPPEWAGKAHACQRGGESATGEWLLFADADCRFRPGGLTGAVQYAQTHDVDLLSLWLAADHRSFWEHALIPLCGALILYWFPPLAANHRRSGVAYANGQFILIRRAAYLQIDGHACARNTVIEDIPLAQRAKRAGLRLRTALGPEIAAVRMYENYREISAGWTRIFIGALQRRWKLLASVVSLLGGSLLPSVGAPIAAVYVALEGWPESQLGRAFCVLLWLHFVAVYSVSFRLWALCKCRRRDLLYYPLSVVVVAAILLRAWWWMVRRRPIVWRGTETGRQFSSTD